MIKNLEKRMKQRIINYRRERLRLAHEMRKYPDSLARYTREAQDAAKHAFRIPYGPKRGTFKRPNLEFDPSTGVATSYNWYNIAQIIKGRLVLNTYRYSVTTAKHISELGRLFDQLKLTYIEIEAPRGLQDLNTALHHTYCQWAALVVANEYARFPNKALERVWMRKADWLVKVGATNEKPLQSFIDDANKNRADRLKAQREKRVRVVDHASADDAGKAGFHHEGIDANEYIGSYQLARLKAEALSRGHRVLYIHRHEGNES